MADSNTQQIITDLNAGWYNVVTQAMGIEDPNFQISQGITGLQMSDSSGLFLMEDAVPPPASVAFFVPGAVKRSSAYQLLLSALLPEGGTDLPDVLADQYADWVSFKATFYKNNNPTTQTPAQVFQQWSDQNLDPGKAAKAKTVFLQATNAPLNQALSALADPNNQQQFVDSAKKQFSLYKYSGTIDAALKAIAAGAATINFDSQTMNTTLQHVTAQGGSSGFFFIFSGGGSSSLDQLNTTAASSRITITGTVGKFGTLETAAGPWLSSAEIQRAHDAQNDNTVWDPQASAGSWDSFFGQAGSLARSVVQLYLVSDYDITVTSHATYSQSDLQQIQTQSSGGIWPFFSSGSSSTTTTKKFTLNADSTLSVRHVLNKGLIDIWGASVSGLT